MRTCIIVIPIYSATLKVTEVASLKQVLTVLSNHIIHLVTYEDLDTTVYKAIFEEYNKPFGLTILINLIFHLLKITINYV